MVPLVERLAAHGALVSVDTWRGPVARAALAAGAAMINDVSGLSDESIASACADTGAALVITHTRAAPKTKAFPDYDDVVSDVHGFLDERMRAAEALGVAPDQIVLDPGIDLAKTPAESIELLRRLPEFASLGRPLLLAVSRKDFVGALTERPPAARDAGTLAAVGAAVRGGARIIRVHDVAGARDYLRVHEALTEGADVRARACNRTEEGGGVSEGLTIAQLSDIHCGSPQLRAEPARPRDRRGERAGPGRRGRVRRPHRRRLPGRVRAGARVPRQDRVRADDRDPGEPRLAQRRVRALRGAVRRAPVGAAPERRVDPRGGLHRAGPRQRADRPRPLRVDRGALRRARGVPTDLRAAPPSAARAGHRTRAQRGPRRRATRSSASSAPTPIWSCPATSTCPTRGGSRTCSW